MTGIVCCARAASGHVTAEMAVALMKSRRLIVPPRIGRGHRSNSDVYRERVSAGRKQCPLWVKSRHVQRKTACPLYPRKRR